MSARITAFLIHMAISAFIALLILLLVFRLWYPAPLHTAQGVTHIFLLLLVIDVILGPLLTLLVFKLGKRTLVMDLIVIMCLQLVALGYGLYTVADGRPAWIVYNVDRFDVVAVVDIDHRQLDKTDSRYRHAPWTGPQWVAAPRPDNPEEHSQILFESLLGGSDLAQRPYLYKPLTEVASVMRQRAQPLENLRGTNDPVEVRRVLQEWPEAAAWVPLMARSKPMVVLLDESRSTVISIVELNPWD